jgi:hypothetical protein
MSIKVKISIAVAVVIAIGILPFTGGFWSGLWKEMSKPSKYICTQGHEEEHMEYVYVGSDSNGNPKYMWMMRSHFVCDKEILNPERIKWDEEHK